MKFFDCDWNRIFEVLPLWATLAPDSRRHFLLAVPSHAQTVSESGYGADLSLVLEGGLVERVAPRRVRPAPDRIEFRRIVRQLQQHPLFDTSDLPQALREYFTKHFYPEELGQVFLEGQWASSTDSAWLERFLNTANVLAWEEPLKAYARDPQAHRHGWDFDPKPRQKVTYFDNPEVSAAATILVRHAMESPEPLRLLAARELLPDALRSHASEAFRGCVRYRLLFPALRDDTLEAVFWVHPDLGRLRHRPAPTMPPAALVNDFCASAFFMEDMAQVLIAASTGECRLKQAGWRWWLHAKAEVKVLADFAALPPWLEPRFRPADRLRRALDVIEFFKFAKHRRQSGRALFLDPSPSGLQWLHQPPPKRLQALVTHARSHRHARDSYGFHFCFVPERTPFYNLRDQPLDLSQLLERVWGAASLEAFAPLARFIEFHTRDSHPLTDDNLKVRCASVEMGGRSGPVNVQTVEEAWHKVLEAFFWDRLVPLGAVDTGLDAQQVLCFRLNSVGRCLVGLVENFSYGQPPGQACVVVQPNFELVFLQPNSAAEADFAIYAERIGRGVGALFRLTRRAAFRAAEQGLRADELLATLARHSAKALPGNVIEEVRGWFARCRHLPLRRSYLIAVADREAALRVQKVLGEKCEPLTPTLLEYRANTIEPELRKELSKEGLFLGEPPEPIVKQPDPIR